MKKSTSTAYLYMRGTKPDDRQFVCFVDGEEKTTIDHKDLYQIVKSHNALVAACKAALRALQIDWADKDSVFDVTTLEGLLEVALEQSGDCPRCHGSGYVTEPSLLTGKPDSFVCTCKIGSGYVIEGTS